MTKHAPAKRHPRRYNIPYLMREGALLGILVGGLEVRWLAHREFVNLESAGPEIRQICLAYMALFTAVCLLAALARKWNKPERVLCGISLAAAIWILPFQFDAAWIYTTGILAVGGLCWLFLRVPKIRWTFRLFGVLLIAFLLWGFPTDWTSESKPSEKNLPNITLVVIDTLRADYLSCYGRNRDGASVSPNLDELADKGLRFENAYAQAPWTRPSTASLFTGLYPASHGIVTPFDPLRPALPTMASMLKERGYETVGFSANPQVSPSFGFHNGFDRFWSSTARLEDQSAGVRLARKLGFGRKIKQPERGVLHSTADDVNQAVERWLGDIPTESPTFLYIHYLDPHDPYAAPEDLLGIPPIGEVDESQLYASQELPPFPLDGSSLKGLSETELRELQRRYGTEIHFVDNRLGVLLEQLRANGIWTEDDYLIITSDHGEEFHEHQQWQHGRSLFEEMIHVPLIVLGPRPRLAVDTHLPVELVDLLPTVAAWSGGQPNFDQHGESLWGSRTKQGAFSHRPREKHPIWSFRFGSKKVVWLKSQGSFLKFAFDLSQDPFEATALPEQGGPKFEPLHRRLAELMESSSEFRQDGNGAFELDSATARNLQQLGYIDSTEDD